MQEAQHTPVELPQHRHVGDRSFSLATFVDEPYAYEHQAMQTRAKSDINLQQLMRNNTRIGTPAEHASQRRRIAVACARCRRRKIKCTGDPGDGSGCNACKSAGADVTKCVFARVGSRVLDVEQLFRPRTDSGGSAVSQDMETIATKYDNPYHYRYLEHRPSLPTLPTRVPLNRNLPVLVQDNALAYNAHHPATADSRNDALVAYSPQGFMRACSAGDALAAMGRHDSLASATYYEHGSHQPLHYAAATCYRGGPADQYAGLHTQAYSALMPAQASHDRRLPAPHAQYAEPFQGHYLQAPRSSVGFRPCHPHDKAALTWTGERTDLLGPPLLGVPASNVQQAQVTAVVSEPVLGYQFTGMPAAASADPVLKIEESQHDQRPVTAGRDTIGQRRASKAQEEIGLGITTSGQDRAGAMLLQQGARPREMAFTNPFEYSNEQHRAYYARPNSSHRWQQPQEYNNIDRLPMLQYRQALTAPGEQRIQ